MPCIFAKRPISFFVLLGCIAFVLSACQSDDTQSTPKKNQPSSINAPLSPIRSLNIAHKTAIFGYLAKKWQLTQLNNTPIQGHAILDLRRIEHGVGQLSLGEQCDSVDIWFDIGQIEQGIMSTKEIERTLDDCSNTFEDHLMSALADLTYVEKRPTENNDTLILSTYQDKMVFLAIP